MRIQYRHPRLYGFLIAFLYSRRLLRAIAGEVGEGHTVFEIAAGYGRLARIIHPSNRYAGVDRNELFVSYGRRQGLDLAVGDVFDPGAYRRSDVLLVVDIIHHLPPPELTKLFDLVFAHANKRVVIVEPAFVGLARSYGPFGALVDRLFKWVDYDGFNRIERWMTNKEYFALFADRFGSPAGHAFGLQHREVGHHHVVTLDRNA